MICLTGDIHHMSLRPRHAGLQSGEVSEVDCLSTYLAVAKKYRLKATVFVTGKAVLEEGEKLAGLIGDEVEVGGHTYSAFRPRLLYGVASRLLRLSNGPCFVQAWDIRRTVEVIRERLGISIVSWRNHAYRHDRNTDRLLHRNGIRYVSDEVRPGIPLAKRGHGSDRLAVVPINTTPDHENMVHAGRTDRPCTPDEWAKRVMGEVRRLHSVRSPAVILAHPSCMYTEDRFESFERLCAFLAGFQSGFMKEVVSP